MYNTNLFVRIGKLFIGLEKVNLLEVFGGRGLERGEGAEVAVISLRLIVWLSLR
ncbi:hypothetical protein [Vibrio echinoideorum]|uniref:hypothetical protein n=1 Tax=Vibrio echinoideorum TaxID=2100116 RepID=UPI0002D738F3